jgi:putative ABC transport system permease protein
MKSARGTAPPGQRWATRAIVIGQVALSLVLIVAASLLIGSALRMANEPPGFDRHGLLTFRLTLSDTQYPHTPQQGAFFDQLLTALQSLPGTRGAALASVAPLAAGSQSWVMVEGRAQQPHPDAAPLDVGLNNVSAGYFELLGIPLQRGRLFSANDNATSPAAAIVNRAFVARYFPGEDPLGRRVRVSADPNAPWLTIVGVVGDVKRFDVFHEMGWLVGPQLYRVAAQNPYLTINVIVRTVTAPLSLVPTIQHTIAGLNGTLAIRGVRTVDDRLDEIMAAPRLRAGLLGAFAALSLLLSGVGIYGVLAQNVVQRRHEIGIRLALGAHPRHLQRMVLSQGARLAAIGLALGGVAAFLSTRLLASFIYQLRPADAWISALAGATVAAAALLATYIPARRATTVDPVAVLRTE